jgi:DNA polymerase/3'-5' exonuclease PolX
MVMPTLDASEVATLLHEFGQRTAFKGGNPYRARAYTRAAENLLAVPEPLDILVAQNRLREIPGVGSAIADIVTRLYRTGSHPALEAMRKEIPAGALELLSVPGLKPEKALRLHQELGIASLDQLEQAAKEDRIRPVKGLGSALQKKVLQGIQIRREGAGRRHIHRAGALLKSAAEQLRRSPAGFSRLTPAALNLSFIPPELREGRGEIEQSLKGKLPHSSEMKTSAALFMRTRIDRTVPALWKSWLKRYARGDTRIWALPITRAPRITPAD